MRRLTLVLVLLTATAAPALAQDEKPYDINIGGGAIFPIGSYKDSFDTGGNFSIGGTYFVNPMIGIQAEYEYNRMNGPEKVLGLSNAPGAVITGNAVLQSNQQINAFIGYLILRSPARDHMVGFYGLAGGGLYHRKIQITSPAVGYVTVCDPYWLVCYPAATSVDQIIGDRSSSDFGIDFGAGITFGHEAKFYIETKYTYVWGPTITIPANLPGGTAPTSTSTNASYWPLTFGVRF